MASTPTQAEAELHVVYEIEAMCRAAIRYAQECGSSVNLATPAGWEDSVFFLEASLAHARVLVMAFGYPGKAERRLVKALDTPGGHEKHFRKGFSHPAVKAREAYGLLSELIGHLGKARWNAPLTVGIQQPIEVAYSVLDALDACGVTAANVAVKTAVDQCRELLTAAA